MPLVDATGCQAKRRTLCADAECGVGLDIFDALCYEKEDGHVMRRNKNMDSRAEYRERVRAQVPSVFPVPPQMLFFLKSDNG